MKTKLTLTVDPEVVTSMKRVAGQRGTSVSSLFEQWARRACTNERTSISFVDLAGCWNSVSPLTDDIEQTRLDALMEKYDS